MILPVLIKKIHRPGVEPDLIKGLVSAEDDGKPMVVECEPNKDLRDTEQIP